MYFQLDLPFVQIFILFKFSRNKQIAKCTCNFDRIWIAFIAFSEVSLLNKADKKMADGGLILADSLIKF